MSTTTSNSTTVSLPTDQAQRDQAIDTNQSFIVQAPAGSGKTSLLVQRYLALLAQVNHPEEIIAITFTRKAAAEMQERIIDALNGAASSPHTHNTNYHAYTTHKLASLVLQQDAKQQWHLQDYPNRLRLQTIDALCLNLVNQAPLAAKMINTHNLVQGADAKKYYALAAQKLINELNNDDFNYRTSLETLLLALDNDVNYCINLFSSMLQKREQWLPYIVSARNYDKQVLRRKLEQSLSNVASEIAQQCQKSFPCSLCQELIDLANFAQANLNQDKKSLDLTQHIDFKDIFLDINPINSVQIINLWLQIAQLLLTKEKTWRKTVGKGQGFPAPSSTTDKANKTLYRDMKCRYLELTTKLQQNNNFFHSLQELMWLPTLNYNEQQWQTLYSLLELLPLAAAELDVLFHQHRVTDYTAISLAAESTLGDSETPSDFALQLDYRIKHILVDEFQDISQAQYRLIEKLTSGWEDGDGRSLFLVGDPMQSIYRFRQAEVGLFLRVEQEGIGNIKLFPLQLTTNFRSTPALVEWFNQTFAKVLPAFADVALGCIPFSPSVTTKTPQSNASGCAQIHLITLDINTPNKDISPTSANEHCEQGCNEAADQNATPPIDSSSLALQQGAPEVSKRSLLNINEHCEQGRNEAADQNATPPIDSSSLALQQDAPEVSKRSLLNINEHCEQGCNEAAEQNATPPIDSSSLALQQGAPEVSKRSLLNINEHCEQGCNEAADQNAKSLRRLEAQHIINITQKIHTNSPHQTIAILVTARNHLQQIIPELKACNIPFNAVELENLNDSIVIQDLLALTRALTNVTDRIAWLAILRAPWCGLCLGDLHALANTNNDNNDENILTIWENLNNYQDNSKLSADGKNRIAKILPILQYSIYNRGRSNLRDWIEKTWLAIGGPGTVNEQAELTHAEQFWPLLETTASSSYTIDIKLLTQKLEQLHVGQSDPTAAIQIMTIHKAKGLEFDHVIVSGLDQTTRSDDNQILMWLERPRLHHNSDLLMAPLKAIGAAEDSIYSYLRHIERQKDYYENGRLLYVASTRARQNLYLVACANYDGKNKSDVGTPPDWNTSPTANEHCEQGRNKAADQNATSTIDSSSLALQQGASEVSKRSLLNINEHCEQGRNKAADQNATPTIDSSSLALQQGASEASKRSLLNINEHCEQGRNEAADQNAKSLAKPATNSLLSQLWPHFDYTWLQPLNNNITTPPTTTEKEKAKQPITTMRPKEDWQYPYIDNLKLTNDLEATVPGTEIWHTLNNDNQDAANFGTVVHKCLLNLAQHLIIHKNIDAATYCAAQHDYWQKLLQQHGFYHDATKIYLTKIKTAITNVLNDQTGQWIFDPQHQDIHNEYAITAVINDKPQNLILDRTFITNDNTCWIIDYKTATPPPTIHLKDFFTAEKNKYRPQLELYAHARAMQLQQQNQPRNQTASSIKKIMLGLYFPLCLGSNHQENCFCSWEA